MQATLAKHALMTCGPRYMTATVYVGTMTQMLAAVWPRLRGGAHAGDDEELAALLPDVHLDAVLLDQQRPNVKAGLLPHLRPPPHSTSAGGVQRCMRST